MVPRIIIQTGSIIKTGNCSLNRKKNIKEATISVTDVILRCICVIWISVSRVISSAVHHLIDRGCQIQSNRVLLSICRGYFFIESIEVMRATSFDVRQSDFTFNMQPYTKITSILMLSFWDARWLLAQNILIFLLKSPTETHTHTLVNGLFGKHMNWSLCPHRSGNRSRTHPAAKRSKSSLGRNKYK